MKRKITAAIAVAALCVGLVFGPSIVQATTDGYQALKQAMQPVGGLYTTSLPSLSTGEHNEIHLDASGRVIVSVGAVTSGTTTQEVVGDAADGAAVAGNPVLIGGQDGTNAQTLLTDTTGAVRTSPVAQSVSGSASIAADAGMLSPLANRKLFKLFVSESAATPAAAVFVVRHGTGTGDVVIATLNIATNGDKMIDFGEGGVPIASGLFLDRASGEAAFTAVYGTVP